MREPDLGLLTQALIIDRNEAASDAYRYSWTEYSAGRKAAFELALSLLYGTTEGRYGVDYYPEGHTPARPGSEVLAKLTQPVLSR